MECCLCEKSQYIEKFKYSVNLRRNAHRNDVWRTDGPTCDKHFHMSGHNFNGHAKFTIIEEVYNIKVEKVIIIKVENSQLVRTQRRFLDFEIANSFPARSKHIT